MKKTTVVLCLALLIAVFLFMFVFSVFFPRTTVSNYSTLKQFPEFSFESLFSGKYFNGIKDYFTDTINSRDTFIDFEAKIRSLYGIQNNGDTLIIVDSEIDDNDDNLDISDADSNIVSQNSQTDISNTTDNSIESSETQDNNSETGTGESSEDFSQENSSESESSNVIGKFEVDEIESRLIILGTRIFEIYGGDPDGDTEVYAATLNAFSEKVGPSVNVYSMVIPKACAYYLQQADGDKYQKYLNKDRDDIYKISELLSGVIDVNVYNILGKHANEDIYFRTDHHWSGLGAYYAATVFAEKAGTAIDPLSDFTVTERNGFLGSLYSRSNGNTALLNNPEIFKTYHPDTDYTVTYYNPGDLESNPREHEGGFFWEIGENRKSDWYSTFIRGDSYSLKAVSNECKNGRKLLIVKDSYGNALAPFIMEGFEEIYIVDAREYNVSLAKTVEKFGITDVLFAQCTFSAAGSGYVNNLKELCK